METYYPTKQKAIVSWVRYRYYQSDRYHNELDGFHPTRAQRSLTQRIRALQLCAAAI
jgi:hypothetical protein